MINLGGIVISQQSAMLVLLVLAAGIIFWSIGIPLIESRRIQQRMKAVASERDRMRRIERKRMEKEKQRLQLKQEPKAYVKEIVERLDLRRHLGTMTARERLTSAGFRGPGPEFVFLFMRLVTPIIVFGLTVFLLFSVFRENFDLVVKLGICIASIYVGIKLPEIWVANLIQKRQLLIQASWPDALDLLVICVESGMPIEQALNRVAAEIKDVSLPLAEELMLLTAELSYLPERRTAYENMGKRVGLTSIKSVIQALIQAERYGTQLAEALKVSAQESRDTRMAAAEKKAASLPPKLTVPMIIFFLPILFVVIMSPAVMSYLALK